MNKMLKCANNDDVITMKADEAADVVSFMFESPGGVQGPPVPHAPVARWLAHAQQPAACRPPAAVVGRMRLPDKRGRGCCWGGPRRGHKGVAFRCPQVSTGRSPGPASPASSGLQNRARPLSFRCWTALSTDDVLPPSASLTHACRPGAGV